MTYFAPLRYGPAVLLAVALLVGGCDSFVDKEPISNPSRANFYESRGDFETAIAGAYDALQLTGTVSNNYWMLFEMRGDNTDQGPDQTGLAQKIALLNRFQETTTNELLQQAWIDTYDGIERCNVILGQIDNLPDSDFKDRVRGEALFLRSLFYYHAAVAWGSITLKTEATQGPDDAANTTAQTDGPGAVYQQIAGDLETAQGLLPAEYDAESNVGKATSGAANALLGKVYLTMGQQGQAQTALQRVIDSDVYRLVDDYGDLWGPANENNAESIFEVQYTTTGGEGSPFTNTFAPDVAAVPGGVGEGLAENRPTPSMESAYLDKDGPRFRASMDTSYVDADGEVEKARYITKYESQPFANFEAENNWIMLRYADVLLMMAEALGPSPRAWDLIDRVRDRSLPDPQFDVDRTGNFYEQLLRERRVELAFENHRWPDLKRFEQYIDGVAEARVNEELADVSGFNLLYPIPQREVDVADLQQNPGYTGGGGGS
ncbi:MAG: RagB/SusD family nutrient uptake outer membrane protein [Salinibacter sp.]